MAEGGNRCLTGISCRPSGANVTSRSRLHPAQSAISLRIVKAASLTLRGVNRNGRREQRRFDELIERECTWMAPAALSAASQASSLPATAPVCAMTAVSLMRTATLEYDHGLPRSHVPAQRLHEGSRLPDLLGKYDNRVTAGSWTIASI